MYDRRRQRLIFTKRTANATRHDTVYYDEKPSLISPFSASRQNQSELEEAKWIFRRKASEVYFITPLPRG